MAFRQPAASVPLTEVTRDVDVEGTVVRPASPQRSGIQSEVTKTTTTSPAPNTRTVTTVTTRQSRRVLENGSVVIQGGAPQRTVVTQASANAINDATNFTIEWYLKYISDERLIRMPNRGDAWDRVLHAAQYFGLHISEFGDTIDAFIGAESFNSPFYHAEANSLANGAVVHDSSFFNGESIATFFNGRKKTIVVNSARDLVSAALASSHALLEIGHAHAEALLTTFGALYEFSVLLTDITRVHNLHKPSEAIRYEATITFNTLVALLGKIAAVYRQKVGDLKPGSQAHVNFDANFGAEIREIWRSKEALSDTIWKHKLQETDYPITVKQLRWKLQYPYNYSVTNRIYEKVDSHYSQASKTRYWLKDVLSSFFNGKQKLLCLTGRESSGKTFLSRWVEERLARPLNVKSYHVLRYTFPFDSLDRATPTAFLKTILLTLLEQNISNVGVYQAIAEAFQHHSTLKDTEPTEAILWKAFKNCLGAVQVKQASIVIILDDCDEINGIQEDFYDKLQECITELPVQVVAFCRSVPEQVQTYALQIDAAKVHEDISSYIRQSLSQFRVFRRLVRQESHNILEAIMTKVKSDWLQAFYAIQIISKETSTESIIQKSRDICSETSDILIKVIESLKFDENSSLITLLSIMLTANRPLTVVELAQLLSIDLRTRSMSAAPDVISLISNFFCDLVVIKDGYVHFRTKAIHSSLKKHLIKMSLFSEQAAEKQLTLLMLLYVKLTLKDMGESSTDVLDYDFVLSLFSENSLLGYVVQNWIKHFQASGFTGPEVSKVFPNSITFALLERTCWTRVYTKKQLVSSHMSALQVRQDCFEDRKAAVLHNLISLGHIYLNVFSLKTDASFYFYEAAKLGEEIFSATSTVVGDCMENFFKCTTGIEINDETEIFTTQNKHKIDIVTWYEEMLRLAIEIYGQKYGINSDEVVSWYQRLAGFYTNTKNEEKAIGAYQEIRAILVARDGKKSNRFKDMNAYFATLDIVLNGAPIDKVGELEEMIFEVGKKRKVGEKFEDDDLRCIELWMRLARSYETCESLENLSHAERLYVSLWQRITANQASQAEVNSHLARIDIALEYARFLSRHERVQEACSILICLWAEYQKHTLESETILLRIRSVAEECAKSGLSTIAVSILTKVLESFSNSGSNEEVEKTMLIMNNVVEETSETTVTTNTTESTVVTEETESVVKKHFERLVDEYQDEKTDSSLFSAAKALIILYIKQNNWHEAEEALKTTLQLTWSEILTASSTVKLCEHSIEECIAMARRLAECYSTQGLFEMAEKIHLQIFYACISVELDRDLGSEERPLTGAQLLQEATTILVAFYEQHLRYKEAIDIYTQILAKYEQELGERHELTIETLYFLADRYHTLGLGVAYEYYGKIVTLLNTGIDYCHHDAIRAGLALSMHYDARRRWDELHSICIVLWATILRLHKQKSYEGEYNVTGKDVTFVYQKYSNVLDSHTQADFSKLYDIAIQYRDIINEGYNENIELVINALITLAKLCETQDDYHQESINSYEEVLDKLKTVETTDTIEETIVETVKKRLARMYVTIVKGSQRATFSLERAIEISLETYHQYKAVFEDYPEQTLNQLACVIMLYQQVDTPDSRERIQELLDESAYLIITVAAVNLKLFHAATSLATLFVNANLVKNGKDLLERIRRTVVYGERYFENNTHIVLNSQTRKAIFIFLIAFEYGLEQHTETLSYSKIMAEIVLESLLHEEYSRVKSEEATIEVILQYGARLRHFWQYHRREEKLIKDLDEDLMDRFKIAYAQYFEIDCNKEVKEAIYLNLMDELGEDRPTVNFEFDTIMLEVGNALVKSLLDQRSFYNASQVGQFIARFSRDRHLYHSRRCIHYGYVLAQYLVGIGAAHPNDLNHPDYTYGIRMLETSRDIMDDVIDAFNTLEIDFETLRSEDLVGLINLLHAQDNNEQLELVLSCLWNSRGNIQSTFGCNIRKIIEIGTRLVHAQFAQQRYMDAIQTAQHLYYNLQRACGRLDKDTLEVSRLLASIYAKLASDGDREYFSYAMDIHHNVMREIASPSDRVYNGYTRHDVDFLAKQAWTHSELWNKLRVQLNDPQSDYLSKRANDVREIYEALDHDFMFDETIDKSYQLPPSQYVPLKAWRFDGPDLKGKIGDSHLGSDVLETARREWVLPTRIFVS
ncbi:hypothetical protein V8C35DRAFT_329143 [Trichoderma chlorosporum]